MGKDLLFIYILYDRKRLFCQKFMKKNDFFASFILICVLFIDSLAAYATTQAAAKLQEESFHPVKETESR